MICPRSARLLLLALLCSVPSARADDTAALRAILDAEALRGVQVGALVVELGRGRVLFERGADTLLIPASNTKLVTTAAALDRLGLKFAFHTRLFLRGKRQGKLLDGDLVVSGNSDPSFSGRFYNGDSTRVLDRWCRALARSGVERISGDLLLDASATSGPAVHPDWPSDQLRNWYCAPVGALNLNDNCVEVTVEAGTPGAPVRFGLAPAGSFAVANRMTTAGRAKHAPWVALPEATPGALELRGTFRAGRPAQTLTIAVRQPERVFGVVLAGLLARHGIRLAGRPRISATPVETGLLLADHRCPIDRVIGVVNKKSQNLFAECLYRALGRAHGGGGSFAGGKQAVEQYLAGLGVRGVQSADGSGLARGNRYSPRAIVAVLARVWGGPARKVFLDSLPVAGVDGTLAKRMRGGPAQGRVQAKTGYIRSVSALSGYVQTRSGRWLAFSLLFNGFQRKGKQLSNSTIKGYQDRICQELAGW